MTCRIPTPQNNPSSSGTNAQAANLTGLKVLSRRAVDLPSNLPPDTLVGKNEAQKPGPVKVVQLLSSFAIEKDYGAYVVGYGHTTGFTKYNKTMDCSVQANDAEIRVFQKDVREALERKDARVEAFVKDNPKVLQS